MEEEESMDFQCMKRKQLQALCKEHGISANLSNREMADRLSLILEKNKKFVSQGDSIVKNSSKKVSESNSKVATKVVKKVRFSPENEMIMYEVSGYKRGGRRCKMKPLPKKWIQVSENVVVSPPPTGRKRARRGVKNDNVEAKSDDESDATGGLVRRRLRTREVVVEKSGRDLVGSEKNVSGRGTKKVENEVSEGNAVAGKDAKPSGRITRSRAKFESKASESGAVQTQFDEIRKDKGRNAMQKSGAPQKRRVGSEILAANGAEKDKVSQQTKPSVTKDGDSGMLIGNSRIIEVSRRSTRSQANIAVKAYEEEIVPLEEPSKDQCRYASRRESVAPKKRTVVAKPMAVDGAEQDKLLRKTGINVIKDGGSEMSIWNSRVVEVAKRSTRSQAKVAGKGSADKSKTEEETVQHNEPSKHPGKSAAFTRKSVVFKQGKMESNELQEKKETRKRSRNTNINLEAASKFEAVVQPSKGIEKVENVSVPSDPSRRTRHNTVVFASSVSTVGELETHEIVEETRTRLRNSDTKLEAASRFEATEENSKTNEKVENVSVPSGPSRRTRRNTIRFTSSVSMDGESETRHTVQETGKRTRNANTNLEAASKFESIVESSKEIENVSVPSGPSRRTRRNAIMFTSSKLTDGELETHKNVPVENPPRRSSRVASKGDLVEPAGPTVKVVGKKRHSRSRMPVIVESPSKSFPAPKEPLTEDARLAVGEVARTKSNLDASYSKQVLESSNKKKMTSRMKQLSSVEVSTVNSVIKEATNSTVNLEETSPANQSNKLNREGGFGDFSRVELEVTGVNNKASNVISPEIASPAVGFSPANQSDNLTEPSNTFAWEKTGESKELSTGTNINHGSDNADDHSNKEDRAFVQECQTLVQLEDAEETAETTIQEALLEENSNELGERSSEKRFKIPLEKAEDIKKINPSYEQGSFHTENLLEVVEMQEIAAESNLIIGESSALMTEEMQLSTNGGKATEATPSRPALVTEAMEGFDNEVNNGPDHTFIANNVDRKEEAYNAEAAQNAEETAKTTIQEALLEENWNELSERSSEKMFKIPLEKAEEISVINPSDEQGSSHTENFLEAVEMQEIVAKSNLVIGESGALSTAEMQLSTNGGNATEATPSRPALETEEAYNAESQNVDEAAETTIQEALLEENQNELGEKTSEKRFKIPLEKAEEINKINPSDEQGSFHTENLLEVVEMQEIAAQSNLSIGESSVLMTAEMQLSTNDGNATEATSSRPALETEAMEGFDNEVNNDPDHIANNVDRKEEADNAEASQNAKETAETTMQEAFLEENRNELGERSSEKRFKINPSDEQGSSHTENFLDDVEMQEIAAESNLAIGESSALMTAEMQLSSNGLSMESDTPDAKDMGFNGESDVEECADVVMEENADCVLGVEFGDKNELEGMAPQVNDAAGSSLREVIVKESEFSDDKRVEIMISPNECIERVDMLKMEESNSKHRNSAAVVMDVGALSQVIVNHIVEMEGADVDDTSIQNSEIATDRETCTETNKCLLAEVDNGGTSVRVSRSIPGKPIREKFTEINDTAPGALNEIVSATCEDLEEKSMEVLGHMQHVNDLKDCNEENVLELEMSRNDTDRKATIIMAGDLNLSFNSSDGVKEDNIENDIDDHLLEVEFHKAGDMDHNVLLDGDTDSERVEDGTKWAQKTPIFSQTIENRSKWSVKNSAKPEMGSNTAAVSHSMDKPSLENKSLEFHVDLPQLTSPDMIMILRAGEQAEVEKSAGSILEANLIQDREDAPEVKENLTNDDHLTVSDKLFDLEITQELEHVLEVRESVTTNEQVNQEVTEKQLGSHITVLDDELLEDSLEVKESVTDSDENVTEKQLGKQENQSHLTVSDDEETNEQNGLSAINQECNYDVHKDNSYISTEKVMMKDATPIINEIQIKASSNNAGGEMVDDEDRGKSCIDVTLLFQEYNDSTLGKNNAAESFSVENYTREVVKEQLGDINDATCPDNIYCSSLNQSPCDNKADVLHIDEGAVSKEIADHENLNGASSLVPEIVVDCSAVSPSYSENAATLEQMKLPENETTDEVAKFKSTLLCDFVQHGTPDHKNAKNESLKLESIDSTPGRGDANLLSPPNKRRGVRDTNSSMKTISSVMRQSNRSQRTPKQLVHDTKENVQSTTRTAHKRTASKLQALEDL